MSEHTARVHWQRNNESFVDNRYSRGHSWSFDGGATIAASASPSVVPPPYSIAENVDPEEAFVASVSSCHMLFFLSLAANLGLVVEEYVDRAVGVLGKNSDGRLAMTEIRLRPQVTFSGESIPSAATIADIHDDSHELCFIANSVRSVVVVEKNQGRD